MNGSTLDDKPPFLSWRALYALVALALVADIVCLAALRWLAS